MTKVPSLYIVRALAVWLLLLTTSKSLWSQKPILSETVSFTRKQINLAELARQLQQQSDLIVAFDAKKMKSRTKIKLPTRLLTIKQLSAFLKLKAGINTEFIGRNLILVPTEKFAINPKPETKNQPASIAKKAPQMKVEAKPTGVAVQQNDSLSYSIPEDTITFFKDTFSLSDVSAGSALNQLAAQQGTVNIRDLPRSDGLEHRIRSGKVNVRPGVFLGTYIDDYFVVNPSLQLSAFGAFVSATYSWSNKMPHFRIGLGYNYAINDKISFDVFINTGGYQKPKQNLIYSYDSTYVIADTLNPQVVDTTIFGTVPLQLKTSLLKIGLSIHYQVSPRLDVYLSGVYNRMSTQIMSNDFPASPNELIPAKAAKHREDFDVIPLRWNLSDNYSNSNARFASDWIGFQLGIRFNLLKK